MTINVGGRSVIARPGDMLTPAEFVAAQQVLTGGTQRLLLGSAGNAVGGNFNFVTVPHVNNLNVPQGVTAAVFARGGNSLGLANADIAGSLVGVSGLSSLLGINATNVLVHQGGMISTANIVGRGVDLSINALGMIQNEGLIASSRNLYLTSGQGSIINSGSIVAGRGSVNFNTPAATLNIDSTGGSITALNSINFRKAGLTGKLATILDGGALSARSINFYAGNGDIRATMESVSGTVNAYGGTAHIFSNSDMTLGKVVLSGDPVIYAAGNLTLTSDLVFSGQKLALLAGRDILSGPAKLINTSSATANGGDVYMVAGVNFTPDTPAAGDYTFASFNPLGGNVQLGGVAIKTGSTKPSGNAGSLTIIANGGTSSNGSVTLGSVNTSAPTGIGGQMAIFAPGSVTLDSLNSSGATGGGLFVRGFTVGTTGGAPVFNSDGSASGGAFLAVAVSANSSFLVNSSINTIGTKSFGGVIDVNVQKDVVVTGKITTSTLADSASGNMVITSNSGELLFRDLVNTSSTAGHGGMTTFSANGGGLELNKGLNTSGKTGGGDVVVNVNGDINIGFNPQVKAPATSPPWLLTHSGGINTSSSTMAAGAIDLNSLNGKISIANDVNAAGFDNGGHLSTLSPGYVRIDGKINTSSKAADGAFVSIDVSGPTTPYDLFGADVGAINASGATNGGSVSITGGNGHAIVHGGIDTHATNGMGKNVSIDCLYEAMVLGNINASGTTGAGNITILPGAHAALTGQGSAAVNGTINTSATHAAAGTISISSTGDTTVGGIKAVGASSANTISLLAPQGQLIVKGDIDGSVLNAATGNGGQGTQLTLGAYSLATVKGNVKLAGGNATSGDGGQGGYFLTQMTIDPNHSVSGTTPSGGVIIGGAVDVRGGNTTAPAKVGGMGGTVTADTATLRVLGSSAGGASINASGGTNPNKVQAPAGPITVKTYAIQSVPSNFDLTSTKKTEFALPGGLFEVGNGAVNGTASPVMANAAVVGKGTMVLHSDLKRGTIEIKDTSYSSVFNEGGSTVIIRTIGFDGKRMLLTPAEAVAEYEQSHLYTSGAQLLSNGTFADTGNVTIGAGDLSRTFTAFNVASGGALPSSFRVIASFGDTGAANSSMHFAGTVNILGLLLLKDQGGGLPEQLSMDLAKLVVGPSGSIAPYAPSDGVGVAIYASKALSVIDNGSIVPAKLTIRNTGGDTTIALGNGGLFGPDVPGVLGPSPVHIEEGLGFLYKGKVTIVGPSSSILQGHADIYAGKIQIGQAAIVNGNYSGSPQIQSLHNLEAALDSASLSSCQDLIIDGHLFTQSNATVQAGATVNLYHSTALVGKSLTVQSIAVVAFVSSTITVVGDIKGTAGSYIGDFPSDPSLLHSIYGGITMHSVFGNTSFGGPGSSLTAAKDISITQSGSSALNATIQTPGFVTLGSLPGSTFPATGNITNSGNISADKGIRIDVQQNGSMLIGGVLTSSKGDLTFTLSDSASFATANVAVLSGRDIVVKSTSSGNVTFADNNQVLATRNLIVSTPAGSGANVVIQNGDVFSAGFGNPVPVTSVVSKSDVLSAGGISITADGALTIGSGFNFFRSYGGDIRLLSRNGYVSLGNQSDFAARGGNISILAGGNVVGGTTTSGGPFGNSFYASSLVNGTAFTGGGIEIKAGTTVSTIAAEVANRPNPFSNQVDASNSAKVLIDPGSTLNKGKIVVGNNSNVLLSTNKDGTHGIFIQPGNEVQNPVIIVQGSNGFTVKLDSVLMESLTPIADQRSTEDAEIVLDTGTDADSL